MTYFAASVDPAETNAEFAKSLKLDYPILSDPEKSTAKAYGVVNEERPFAQRWTYFIGKDGKILHIEKEVKIDSHGEDIAKKLEELGVDKKE